jgi:hypothetical protein
MNGSFGHFHNGVAGGEARPRIVLAGGPRTGKTTMGTELAQAMGVALLSTDTLTSRLDWSGCSLEAAQWMRRPGPWCIEGVATGRALRKWLAAHPDGKPCDEVVYLDHPWQELTNGQAAMTKGCWTVFSEIRATLEARGVRVTVGRTKEIET